MYEFVILVDHLPSIFKREKNVVVAPLVALEMMHGPDVSTELIFGMLKFRCLVAQHKVCIEGCLFCLVRVSAIEFQR